MSTYVLTPERLAEYAKRFDFRTQVVKAARQILTAGGVPAIGPGEGVQKVPRYYTSVDYQRGAATGNKSPVALGDRRYSEYSEYFGVMTVINEIPVETIEKTAGGYLTEDHVRTLDELCAKEQTLFMEHLEPFTGLLPYLDVLQILPIEPDERPVQDRETNRAYMRWRVRLSIRYEGWPSA